MVCPADYVGGTYLTVQVYVDRQDLWNAQTTEYQEQVVGRSKMDDIELDDDEKPAWAFRTATTTGLLDFVEARTGTNYLVPSETFLEQFTT